MSDYYSENLSAERLRLCYEIAPERVKRYLEAEIAFVLERISDTDRVLELGCGYGRILHRLASKAQVAVGIDTSPENLRLARDLMTDDPRCRVFEMDASDLKFRDGRFDVVVCIQNGVSAFGVDQLKLVKEALRVTRRGGTVLFSSYAAGFWPHRLEWFRLQAERGLLGEIDELATGEGVIVCKDGFLATTVGATEFADLAAACEITPSITEVDGSSLFCVMRAP